MPTLENNEQDGQAYRGHISIEQTKHSYVSIYLGLYLEKQMKKLTSELIKLVNINRQKDQTND